MLFFILLRALVVRLRVMPTRHVYFRLLGDVPSAYFRVSDPVRQTTPRYPRPDSHIDCPGNTFLSLVFTSISAFLCNLRFVFTLPLSFPDSAVLLRLRHYRFLYLTSSCRSLSGICFREGSYRWRLGLITRCGGISSSCIFFLFAASSTPFSPVL